MLTFVFTLAVIAAIAWFVRRVVRTERELVEKTRAREMSLLAQHMGQHHRSQGSGLPKQEG